MEIRILVYHNHYVTEKYEETYSIYVYIIYSIYSVIDLKSLARLDYEYTCIRLIPLQIFFMKITPQQRNL